MDVSGKVGIATSSPRENLTVVNTNLSDNGQQSFIRHNQYFSGSSTLVENSSYGTVQIGLNRQGTGALTFETGAVNTTTTERMRIDSSGAMIHKGAATFNEDGIDADFRVESNNNSNALFVDAGVDKVAIGHNAPVGHLDIYRAYSSSDDPKAIVIRDNTSTSNVNLGGIYWSHTGDRSRAAIKALNSGAYGRKDISFWTSAASSWTSTDADMVKRFNISYTGNVSVVNDVAAPTNSVSNPGTFKIRGTGWDTSRGSRTQGWGLQSRGTYSNPVSGQVYPVLNLQATTSDDAFLDTTVAGFVYESPYYKFFTNGGAVFNEGSYDQDFRIESNNYSSCFKVDAGNDTININSTTLQNASLSIAAKTTGGTSSNWGQGGYTNLALSMDNTVGAIGQIGFVNKDSTGADMYCGMGAVMNSGSGVGIADLVFFTKPSGSNAPSVERARFRQTGSINGMYMQGCNNVDLYGTNNDTGVTLQGSGQRQTGNGAAIQVACKEDEGWANLYLNRWFDSSQDTRYIQFSHGSGASIGSINRSGSSAVVYNTSSDYRLKENVATLSDGIDRVKQLQPIRFSWIVDAEDSANVDGFLAHQAQTVVPEAVTGEKDATKTVEGEVVPDYQGIDHSKLVPLLTAALQEAITKIEDLEARIAALET